MIHNILHFCGRPIAFVLVVVGLLVWEVIYDVRDLRKKEFMAKLMDCDYLCIAGNDYYIPKNIKSTKY